MEYKNPELETRMVVKERPTVREQLRYKGALGLSADTEFYIRLWEAGKCLIDEWECPHLKLDDNLDEVDNPKATDVIMWAGTALLTHINKLEAIPKN